MPETNTRRWNEDYTPLPFPWQYGERTIYLQTGELEENCYWLNKNGVRSYFADCYEEIQDWARTNRVSLGAYDSRNVWLYEFINNQGMAQYRPSLVVTFLIDDIDYINWNPQGQTCSNGHENRYFEFSCSTCEERLYCSSCNRFTENVSHINGVTYCNNCSQGHTCEDCGRYCERDREACVECRPPIYCDCCNEETTSVNLTNSPRGAIDNWQLCDYCFEMQCQECHTVISEDEDGPLIHHDGLNICRRCVVKHTGGENWEENGEMAATKLALKRIPGRESIRLCGVEIEGANGNGGSSGNIIARMLYDEGISEYSEMRPYHHGNRSFAHVERDSSVDWEMVIGPINMADISDVRALNKCVKVVRTALKNDFAKFDMRCGLHIHVGAEKVGLHQAFNLHLLYSYLEDVMYRLGSAKWKFHRSIINTDHYCQKAEKTEDKLHFARRYEQNRYFGLSFSNYFNGMLNGCECGARRYGTWEDCTCNINKCTFEFRLFNTTANTTKLHAYLALTQALVAKAIQMPEIKNINDYPGMTFNDTIYKEMGSMEKQSLHEKWIPRLQFIFNELPLTDEEKESIMYCVVNSDLAIVADRATEGGQ
jgi:hypothetical protein